MLAAAIGMGNHSLGRLPVRQRHFEGVTSQSAVISSLMAHPITLPE